MSAMCGIVGYIGEKNSTEVVMRGLKRLEYRGYDSAGISFLNSAGELELIKSVGKLESLESTIGTDLPVSSICVGHTRWATHGQVVQENAHPHVSDNLAIVHNGIIENYAELKESLMREGYKFKSETDTEVFLILLQKFYDEKESLIDATINAFKLIKGNSALVIFAKTQEEIVAVKRGAPLVCGKTPGEKSVTVSSDPYALMGYAEQLFFPEDEVLCRLSKKDDYEIEFLDFNKNPSSNFFFKSQTEQKDAASKNGYEHFMLKEIHEQPQLIRSYIEHYLDGDAHNQLTNFKELEGRMLHIVACGTAWHAGLAIRDLVEKYNGIPTNVELASEFRYRGPLLNKEDIGLFISQSGETADTLAAQKLCADFGMKTISIVNTEGSTLYRNCDQNLLIRAGQEIGVASTKAFTLMVLSGFLTSRAIRGQLSQKALRQEMIVLADRIEGILNNSKSIQRVAAEIYNKRGFLFTGRGRFFPIALEGALKLKEIAYVHAEGYAAGELKHGPIALIDEGIVNIAIIAPELYDKTLSNIEEVKARRGIIVAIAPQNDKSIERLADHYIPLDFSELTELAPLYVNVVTQLLSYYMAKFKGTDIDRPRNLAKSVTVE